MVPEEEPDQALSPEEELRQMRKFYQQSRSSLLPYGILGVVITLAGIAVQIWGAGCSWWAWIVLMVIAWHGFIGDLINVLYLRRRIVTAERQATEPPE